MTELFPHAINVDKFPDKIPPKEYLHNWLYSVVPASRTEFVFGEPSYVPNSSLSIFLAGYCKNCNKVFSVQIPTFDTGEYREMRTNIPKTGCVPATLP